jgi:hypothetical protein
MVMVVLRWTALVVRRIVTVLAVVLLALFVGNLAWLGPYTLAGWMFMGFWLFMLACAIGVWGRCGCGRGLL